MFSIFHIWKRRSSLQFQKGISKNKHNFFKRLDPEFQVDDYQTVRSRLELSKFGMCTQFPLDVMHQIDLGVCKFILTAIKERVMKTPLTKQQINEMDALFITYSKYTPSEFNRRPRSIKTDLPLFKATELRQFLLYTGMVLLKDFLSDEHYNHFLLLVCSYRFLSSSEFSSKLIDVDNMLKRFVVCGI